MKPTVTPIPAPRKTMPMTKQIIPLLLAKLTPTDDLHTEKKRESQIRGLDMLYLAQFGTKRERENCQTTWLFSFWYSDRVHNKIIIHETIIPIWIPLDKNSSRKHTVQLNFLDDTLSQCKCDVQIWSWSLKLVSQSQAVKLNGGFHHAVWKISFNEIASKERLSKLFVEPRNASIITGGSQ